MVMRANGDSSSLSFEQWLDSETFGDFLSEILHTIEEKFAPSSPVCPICGSKNTTVTRLLFTSFNCDDCNATILFSKEGKPSQESRKDFIRRLTNKGEL
jgi:ribosomal protein L37AE/L43A